MGNYSVKIRVPLNTMQETSIRHGVLGLFEGNPVCKWKFEGKIEGTRIRLAYVQGSQKPSRPLKKMNIEKHDHKKCNANCRKDKQDGAKLQRRATEEPVSRRLSAEITVKNPFCAGLDLHKETIWACASPSLAAGCPEVRTFKTSTPELRRLASYLKSQRVTTVAMESTGVYWTTTYRMLRDEGLNPILINPSDPKRISGRPKTDRQDCIWICRLHQYGFLKASFVAPDDVRALKELERARERYLEQTSRQKQQMIGELVKMNLRLDVVLTDVSGASGMAILDAIVNGGVRAPEKLYELLNVQIRKKMPKEQILAWLEGSYDETAIRLLKWLYDDYLAQMARLREVNDEIVRRLRKFPRREDRKNLPPAPKNYREDSLQFSESLRPIFFEILGRDLTQLPGVGAKLLLSLVSTTGTDLSAWPDAKHFTSWLGLAPVANVSAGHSKGASTKSNSSMLTNSFRVAAMSAKKTRTYIGCSARRLASRLLSRKARTAVARKLAEIVFNILRHGAALHVWTEEEYEQRRSRRKKDKAMALLLRQINSPDIMDDLREYIERTKADARMANIPVRV